MNDDNQCPICFGDLNDVNNPSCTTSCGHAFHKKCIDTWFAAKTTCPVCRQTRCVVNQAVAGIERLETLLSAEGTPPEESIEPLVDAFIEQADLSTVRDVRDFNERTCECIRDDSDEEEEEDRCRFCRSGMPLGVKVSVALMHVVIARLRATGVRLTPWDIEWSQLETSGICVQKSVVRVDDRDMINAYVIGLYECTSDDVERMAGEVTDQINSIRARGYNVLRIMSGLGGLAYNS